jgi:hypothetical protein
MRQNGESRVCGLSASVDSVIDGARYGIAAPEGAADTHSYSLPLAPVWVILQIGTSAVQRLLSEKEPAESLGAHFRFSGLLTGATLPETYGRAALQSERTLRSNALDSNWRLQPKFNACDNRTYRT